MQPIQNMRERFNCLRPVATSIMQQNDAAVATLLFHTPKNDVCSGFRPILWIDTFQNDEVIKIFGNL